MSGHFIPLGAPTQVKAALCVAGLLDLANSYCEAALKRVCERIIKQGITIDNAAMLYAAAIKYEAKVLRRAVHLQGRARERVMGRGGLNPTGGRGAAMGICGRADYQF